MSIKEKILEKFRLLPMTIRGIGIEPYLCLEAYRRGYPCILSSAIPGVVHMQRDSLSRPKNLPGITERYAEFTLSPYYLHKMGEKINMTLL
ncbi:hypothetical protein HLB03_05950 [Acidianus sp. DSM 29099]|nr:hypothetical protein [Acidianus sp. RZ1]